MKTWLASAMLVGGVGGAGAFVLAVANGPDAPAALPPTSRLSAANGTSYLTRQTSALLAEDRALQRAVAGARKRLGDQVAASEHTLSVLRQRLITTEVALAQAQAGRTALRAAPVQAAPVQAAPALVSHATTGASGTGGQAGGETDD